MISYVPRLRWLPPAQRTFLVRVDGDENRPQRRQVEVVERPYDLECTENACE